VAADPHPLIRKRNSRSVRLEPFCHLRQPSELERFELEKSRILLLADALGERLELGRDCAAPFERKGLLLEHKAIDRHEVRLIFLRAQGDRRGRGIAEIRVALACGEAGGAESDDRQYSSRGHDLARPNLFNGFEADALLPSASAASRRSPGRNSALPSTDRHS